MKQENIIQKLKEFITELESEQQDPYAELKAAHADGKVIQFYSDPRDQWIDASDPGFFGQVQYRIKPGEPWTLPRHLPGFRALRDGEEWHFADRWKQEWLPNGTRPLLVGEDEMAGDEAIFSDGTTSRIDFDRDTNPQSMQVPRRTKRPLPILTAAQVADGWKEWHGGENPAPGKRIEVMFRYYGEQARTSNEYRWAHKGTDDDIIAYRVIEPRLVPLGRDDVRCGDEVKLTDTRYCIAQVESDGVFIANYGRRSFTQLQEAWKIRRRNSDTFEPCSKEAAE